MISLPKQSFSLVAGSGQARDESKKKKKKVKGTDRLRGGFSALDENMKEGIPPAFEQNPQPGCVRSQSFGILCNSALGASMLELKASCGGNIHNGRISECCTLDLF